MNWALIAANVALVVTAVYVYYTHGLVKIGQEQLRAQRNPVVYGRLTGVVSAYSRELGACVVRCAIELRVLGQHARLERHGTREDQPARDGHCG